MGQPTAEVAGEAGTAEAPPTRSWRKLAWWAWVAPYVVAGVTLFFCYRRLSETQPVTSDGAANALQAWDMLHGNLLLRGWTVSDVSFYTTELPEYMGVELIRGLGPDVVHVAAAFTYTLLVLLAGLLAKGRAKGREALVRVLIASGIMIAPQLSPGTSLLLLSPDHTGTQVPLLVTWLVLDRAPRRWYVPLIIAVMLTWVQIGDRITLIVAVVPLALVCALRMCRGLVRREPLTSRWYEVSLAVAAVASVGAAWLAVRVIDRLSGYAVSPLPIALATPFSSWSPTSGGPERPRTPTSRGPRGMTGGCTTLTSSSRPWWTAGPHGSPIRSPWPISDGRCGSITSATTPS